MNEIEVAYLRELVLKDAQRQARNISRAEARIEAAKANLRSTDGIANRLTRMVSE